MSIYVLSECCGQSVCMSDKTICHCVIEHGVESSKQHFAELGEKTTGLFVFSNQLGLHSFSNDFICMTPVEPLDLQWPYSTLFGMHNTGFKIVCSLSLSICVLFEILRFCPTRLCLSRRPSKSQRFKAHGGRPDQAEIPCPSFLGRPSPTDAWIILLGWMRIHTADCLQLMASIQVKCNTYSQ